MKAVFKRVDQFQRRSENSELYLCRHSSTHTPASDRYHSLHPSLDSLGNVAPVRGEQEFKHGRRLPHELLLRLSVGTETGLQPSQRLLVIPLPILADRKGDAIVRGNTAAEQFVRPGLDDERQAVLMGNRIAFLPHGLDVAKRIGRLTGDVRGTGRDQCEQACSRSSLRESAIGSLVQLEGGRGSKVGN